MPGPKRSWKLQEFVAHGADVSCAALGHKSGRVLVTGGEDKKVNLWAVGKPNCIMSLTGKKYLRVPKFCIGSLNHVSKYIMGNISFKQKIICLWKKITQY